MYTMGIVRLLLVGLCLAPLMGRADVVLVDRIAASVDLHAITRSALEIRARPLLAVAKSDAQKEEVRRAVLLELIEEALIRIDAERLGIELRDAEVEAALGEVAKQNQLTVAELVAEIQRQGLELQQYKTMLRAKLLELRWLNARMNHAKAPDAEAERVTFTVSERTRLMNELRLGAVIEVRL